MRSSSFIIHSLIAFGVGLVILGSPTAQATNFDRNKHKDRSVCYAGDPNDGGTFVVRLDVKHHSPLTTRDEFKRYEHPVQTTYTALGKVGFSSTLRQRIVVMSADGSVIVAKKAGTLMGLTVRNFDPNLETGSRGTANWQCRGNQPSATPEIWSCTGTFLNTFGELNSTWFEIEFDLTRISPLDNKLCSEFFPRDTGDE